jgi:hypothetical protein
LVGLVIGGQSDGHGVTLRDLSTERGEAHRGDSRTQPQAVKSCATPDLMT